MSDWGATWAGVGIGLVVASLGWAILLIKVVARAEAVQLAAFRFGAVLGPDGDPDGVLHPSGECSLCDDLRRALGGDWGRPDA